MATVACAALTLTCVTTAGQRPDVDERFVGPTLDPTRWVDHYLPHWSTPDRTQARYELGRRGLTLRIDPDQPAFSPEYDGELRVSNLQSGTRSGPVGSADGQHRFRDGLLVRTAQPTRPLWLLGPGTLEARIEPCEHRNALTALWLIGFEDTPDRSGELCVVELFGDRLAGASAAIGTGVHPFGDPTLADDHRMVPLALDLRAPLDYRAEWGAWGWRVSVDGSVVASGERAPAYPLQIMLNLYLLPGADGRVAMPSDAPLTARVEYLRYWAADA
ncbi:hypothetical protein EV141_0445 [Microcella putealis]|uniref:GH16 domain-containing protein n=1 Tax=Microcella putealis TaxID=337005 RepID=A0A4Q7LXM0_9MICO|nr:hypothetical protein EV141_0445 [Microcella putealis]TQM24253.1 hypothetical protein BJ957_1724 [Microcella putealis]